VLRSWPAAVALAAVVFGLCQLPGAPGRLTPDSTEYLVQTLHLLGDSPQQARERTLVAFCQRYRPLELVPLSPTGRVDPTSGAARVAECENRVRAQGAIASDTRFGPAITEGGPIVSGRYEAIFLARPGMAVLFAPAVALFGPAWGVWLTILLCAVAAGVLVAVVLRTVGLAAPLALLGQVLFYVLPTGKWAMAPLAESPTLLLVLVALLGAVRMLNGRLRSGIALLVIAHVAGFTIKYSQFLLVGVGMAAAAGIALAFRSLRSRPMLLIAMISGVAAVANLGLAAALGWPSGYESAQDLLTVHFTQPDVPNPYYQLLRLNRYFWSWWIVQQLLAPLLLVAWLAGAWALLRGRPAFGVLVLGVAAAGLANQAGHPMALQVDRLYVLAWLVAVCGLPVLVERLARWRDADHVLPAGEPAPGAAA